MEELLNMPQGDSLRRSANLTRRQVLLATGLAATGVSAQSTIVAGSGPNPLLHLNPRHAWLRSARIFALESWWPPFWPHLEVDWDKALWTMKRLHLDTLQANALTKWACYQTTLVKHHPELGSRDLIKEAQDFCAKNGFKWIIYSLFGHAMPISTQMSKTGKYAPALFRPILTSRGRKPSVRLDTVPEEFQDYQPRFHFGDERYVGHCVFAAEDWLLGLVSELAGRYDYDACWLDGGTGAGEGWSYDGIWNLCCCSVCQQAYITDFKVPMPLVETSDDPRLLPMRRWVERRLDAVLERVSNAFTKNRRVPIVGNMATGMGNASFYPPILRNYDGRLFEHAPDTIQMALNLKLSRQITNVAIYYPDCYDPWPRRVTSGWEVENKGLIIAGCGGTPYLAQPGKYYYDAHNDEPARRIFEFMENNRTLLDEQEELALYAIGTQPPFHRSPAGDFAALGWYSALLDSHEPVTAGSFHQLEDLRQLKRYPAWILPNTEYLSDRALAALRTYVEEGGGVYLSCNAGSIDENRRMREGGGRLRELLDIAPWQPSREQILRRQRFEGRSQSGTRELQQSYEMYMKVGQTALGFPLPHEIVQPAHLGYQVPGPSWTVLASVTPTDRDEALMPALAVKSLGKGRLAYSSAAWGVQYSERREPYLASWMALVARWLAGGTPPYQLVGPRNLFCAPNRVKGGWLFYLVNGSNDIQGRRQEWGEMMKVWDRPLPIGKVELSIRGAVSAQSIYGPPPQETVARDGSLHIAYRDFRDHAVLMIKRA